MKEPVAETISFEQIEEIIEWIKKIHGFDFGGYSRASLKRRIVRIMQLQHLSIYELKSLLVNNSSFFEDFLSEVTVNVTEMFRDPSFFRALREKVLPYLSSFQRIKIWNAGCSTGEELYSFAILLDQAKLYSRSFLYGTDVNRNVLNIAKKGVYNLKLMSQYAENFLLTQPSGFLADYYVPKYDTGVIVNRVRENTLFSVHNLVSDGVFNEFQLISCRNVMIYFDVKLQSKVFDLFYESLCPLGFLCLGSKESIRNPELLKKFKVVDRVENIYQKIG